eukprot:2478567-Rhodomonas_salina.1
MGEGWDKVGEGARADGTCPQHSKGGVRADHADLSGAEDSVAEEAEDQRVEEQVREERSEPSGGGGLRGRRR